MQVRTSLLLLSSKDRAAVSGSHDRGSGPWHRIFLLFCLRWVLGSYAAFPMQATGLVHDLGKLLFFFGSEGQWDVVGVSALLF